MWLMCSECGATLPSSQARCPVCGRQPAAPERPARRRVLWPLVVGLLVIGGITAGVLLLDPPFLTAWTDGSGLPFG